MDSIEEEKELVNSIIEKIKGKLETGVCHEFASTWLELWDEDERNKRKNILAEECTRTLEDFLTEILLKEKTTKNDYIDRIEKLLNEISELQKNLEITIPYEDVENLPLHNMAFHLNKKAETYRILKNERLKKLNELSNQEDELCKQLGMISTKKNFSEIPTKDELKQYENHIIALQQEKTNRSLIFKEQCQKISSLFRELDFKPTLKFEKDILSPKTHENFILSNENMKQVEELLKWLDSQVEENKQTVKELRDKLNLIWDYLDEPEEHKKLFTEAHSGYSRPVINALKKELNRCEVQKRENISKIVKKIRQILVQEWDKCLISQEERDKFRAFNIDCFTEDLCELHELEIEKLRNFYRKNEQIFNLISKHEKLFKKLVELENTSKNVDRYYNRGGRLLQEERERKTITKELPLVEDELRNLLKKYEEDHGEPFTSFGVPTLLILDEQWNAHFDQKKIEKLTRKVESEKKSKTPLGKRVLTTPGSSVANKIAKFNNEKAVSSTTKNDGTSVPVKKGNSGRKICLSEDQPDSTFTVESTYAEFQNALHAKVGISKSKKGPLRSTAVKSTPVRPVLRERNTPIMLRSATAMAKTTPAKLPSAHTSCPAAKTTPKSFPRSSRRQNQITLTPAVNRLPLII